MTEWTNDPIRDVIDAAISDAPEPHPWAEVQRRADVQPDDGSPRRTVIWLAAAASVLVLVAGFVVLVNDDGGGTIRTNTTTTVESTTTTTTTIPAPTTTVDAGRAGDDGDAAAPTATAPPATASVPAASETVGVADLSVPESGETQQTVIGEVTWTLLEGDETTQPPGVSAVIDGVFYGLENDGRTTWRSPDGVEWELTDLEPNGILGIFEIDGESWARRSTLAGQGLGRWNGEEFEPVDLPPSLAPQAEGLSGTPAFGSDPVQLGDEWIIPVTTRFGLPWNERYPGGIGPEWDVVTETIRLFDWESNDPMPVAVIEVDVVERQAPVPGLVVEFRDTDTGELVFEVSPPAGVDLEWFVQRLVSGAGFTYHELLIGDGSGFEAVESPVPLAENVRLATIGDTLLAVAQHPWDPRGGPTEAPELWASTDGRSWELRELPTAAGSNTDWVALASDGSLALLNIVSSGTNSQQSEYWSSTDGVTWTPTGQDFGFGFVDHTDVGWFRGDVYDTGGISVSNDGLTWQAIDFDIRPPAGAGGSGAVVHGDTIFITVFEGNDRLMWVGQVADG